MTIPELLWERLTELYGHRFTSAYSDNPNQGWELALTGLSPEMIGKGLKRMSQDARFTDWPPNALGFRRLCLPTAAELGLPGDGEAYRQAVGLNTQRHPAVVYALRNFVGGYELRREKERMAKKIWSQAWAETVDYVAAGGELPAPEKQIEEKNTPATKSVAEKGMAALKDMFT